MGIDIIQKSGHVAVSDFENHRVQVGCGELFDV